MRIKTDPYRVTGGKSVDLGKFATRADKPAYSSKSEYETMLRAQIERMGVLQDKLYAASQYALLVIFQAMDAAGKDGAIKHVMSGINPQGVQVFSFKQPSAEELDHDFLWRTNKCLPEKGRIGIFNRSYYEEVLVVKVHPEYLAAQNLPQENADSKTIWDDRYRSITDMEAHLHRNGTRIVKIFLHLSKDEQRKRFLARIDAPEKNWKFNVGDVSEREHWKEYRAAYQECFAATGTKKAPWYVVPADDKENARLIAAQIIVETLESLPLEYPKLSSEQTAQLATMRESLTK